MRLAPLIGRWSRRDRLAVLLIAITVAFLVGTTVVLAATSAATTGIAADYGGVGTAERYDSLDAATANAGPSAVVIPLAELDEGSVRTVVGVPEGAGGADWPTEFDLPSPPDEGLAVVDPSSDRVTLGGGESTVTVASIDRSRGVFPADWGVARPSLIEDLGPTGAIVLSPPRDGGDATRGTPLQAGADFFRAGSSQVLSALTIVAAGVGLLVAVVIFGVVRMSARARRRTVFVIRATGGTRRQVLAAFTLRGVALTLVGAALGYALGVIAVNVAVNAGTAIGVPTSLSARIGPAVAGLLLGIGAMVVALGAIAAYLAARPVASRLDLPGAGASEHASTPSSGGSSVVARVARGWRDRFGPRLLSTRTLVPMVVTLATFAVIALLIVAGASAAAPLSDGGSTIVEPGTPHPIASTVPVAYADAIDDVGASPEILAFTVLDGKPVIVRGANYDDFATVTDSELIAGERPTDTDDALVGADLARTLDVEIGDTLTIGGSTTPAVTTVDVVGVYEAPGPYDDALIVRLDTARHLTNAGPETVQFVRTDRQAGTAGTAANVSVISVDVADVVPRGTSTNVTATVLNPSATARDGTVGLSVDGDRVANRTVRVGPLATERVQFSHAFSTLGNRSIEIDGVSRSVPVVAPGTPRVSGLPATAPPGSEPRIAVRTVTDRPIPNATVSVGDRTYQTGADGTVRIDFSDPGERTVLVEANGQRITQTVSVDRDARRGLVGTLTVSPSSPNLLTRPTARIQLSNPWNVSRSGRVALLADDSVLERNVTLGAGEARTITRRLQRRAPGTYSLALHVDGERLATTNVSVEGNSRLSSALASTDAAVAGGGLGAGVAMVLGNLSLLAGTLAAFAGVLAVGSVTFGLASGVYGRRRTLGIYRATGASPGRVLGVLVSDGLRLAAIAVPASLAMGLGALVTLDALDRLVFFGVRVDPVPSLGVLGVVAAGSVAVVVAATLAVGVSILRPSPGNLLTGDVAATRIAEADRTMPGGDDDA